MSNLWKKGYFVYEKLGWIYIKGFDFIMEINVINTYT